MQGPIVKLIPVRTGVFENADEESRESCSVEGHVKEENSQGWVIAECGTFIPKECYEEVERSWDVDSKEMGDSDE